MPLPPTPTPHLLLQEAHYRQGGVQQGQAAQCCGQVQGLVIHAVAHAGVHEGGRLQQLQQHTLLACVGGGVGWVWGVGAVKGHRSRRDAKGAQREAEGIF